MPISLSIDRELIHTIAVGRVTDDELIAHYGNPAFSEPRAVWLELVDGRAITEMAVTADGQRRLETLAAAHLDRLRGGRVAMVASSDVAYGMFRMWQMRREGLGFEVQVFRDFDAARAWLLEGVAAAG
jgi:hypothetical protein